MGAGANAGGYGQPVLTSRSEAASGRHGDPSVPTEVASRATWASARGPSHLRRRSGRDFWHRSAPAAAAPSVRLTLAATHRSHTQGCSLCCSTWCIAVRERARSDGRRGKAQRRREGSAAGRERAQHTGSATHSAAAWSVLVRYSVGPCGRWMRRWRRVRAEPRRGAIWVWVGARVWV